MHHCLNRLAAALALGLPLLAAAQGRADPADPKAPAHALAHRSAIADYKPFQDITPGDWRRLNDAVGRAALKLGATTPESGPPPAASAASAPAAKMPLPRMPGHHQHMQGGRQ
jgi:hypothetical protein